MAVDARADRLCSASVEERPRHLQAGREESCPSIYPDDGPSEREHGHNGALCTPIFDVCSLAMRPNFCCPFKLIVPARHPPHKRDLNEGLRWQVWLGSLLHSRLTGTYRRPSAIYDGDNPLDITAAVLLP